MNKDTYGQQKRSRRLTHGQTVNSLPTKNAKNTFIGNMVISISSIEKTDSHMEKNETGTLEGKPLTQIM